MRKIDQRTRRVIPKRADGTTFTYTEALAVPVEKAGGRQESWSEQPPSSVSESGRPHLRHPRAPRGGRRSGQERRTTVGEMEHGLSQKAVEIPFHFLELLVGLVQALVFTLLTAVFTLLVKTDFIDRMTEAVPVLSVIMLCGCEGLTVRDTSSLLVPRFQRSEVFGFVAGFGTIFAAVPDLVGMLKRRSSKGMNPTMAGIMGVFQIAWIYHGLLIASRPVIAWNRRTFVSPVARGIKHSHEASA